MARVDSFPKVFNELKNILKEHEDSLLLKEDTSDNYYLNTPYSEEFKKELFFGAVQVKKNYVSYHLMPVYMYPDLLDDLSPILLKRMQGKSCFNFTEVNREYFSELTRLTRMSFDRLKTEGIV